MTFFSNLKSRIFNVPSKLQATTKAVKYLPNITYARVASVYDGDTITIAVIKRHLFKTNEVRSFKVRIARIDCAEIRGSDENEKQVALIAKEFVKTRLEHNIVKLDIQGYDKYGRLLAEVFYNPPTSSTLSSGYKHNIADDLLKAKLAVRYDGKAKEVVDWKKKYQEACNTEI